MGSVWRPSPWPKTSVWAGAFGAGVVFNEKLALEVPTICAGAEIGKVNASAGAGAAMATEGAGGGAGNREGDGLGPVVG